MNERIRRLRKYLKLNQNEFAKKIGLAPNTITNYETGRRNPSDAIIFSICREFNINEEWLRTGTGDMFNNSSTFSLDEYAEQRDMSDLEKDIIRCYLELPKDTRKEVLEHFTNYFSNKENKKKKDHSDMFAPIAAHTDDTSEENMQLMLEDLEDE